MVQFWRFPLIQLPRKSEVDTLDLSKLSNFKVSINSTSEEVRSCLNDDLKFTNGPVSINSTSEEVRRELIEETEETDSSGFH